ncbi:MAG TPA: efflux RND transporter permease subunit [Patescibacteria group bacterium]|nr:efflux RND transporter permease subunit [Patescibacteria group bacterium]
MADKAKKPLGKQKKLKPLQKLSLFFFNRPRKTAILWLVLTVFGVACYTNLLNREGFPAIETPFAVAQGAYLVNDPAKVDKEIAKPMSEYLLKQDGVKSVQSQAQSNFYSVIVSYEESVNAESRSKELQDSIDSSNLISKQATLELTPFKFGFTERGDNLVVSLYSPQPISESGNSSVDTAVLTEKAKQAAEYFRSKNLPLVESVSVIDPFKIATDPTSGQAESTQQSFDRYGEREGDDNNFYKSAVIGFTSKKDVDNLELNAQVQAAVNEINSSPEFAGYNAEISASYAPQVKAQVNELQKVLLEGLIAVLVVGSLVIAIRASLLTVISMVTVLAIVNGLLFAIGYTLNTITLFSLILALALIIDDTIIMVEALDAQRRRQKNAAKAVSTAVGKVSRAMIAATLTAALSFAPLIFVGGILGEFIRAIPISIMSALFISLLVALIFIPLFARFIFFSKKQLAKPKIESGALSFEHKIAEFLSQPMLRAKNSKLKLAGLGTIAVLISFSFIGASGYLFQKVTFNIFPPSKDTNQLSVTLNLPPQTSLDQAQATADKADKIIAESIGQNFDRASYYGIANIKSATLTIDLIDYKQRDIKAPELVNQLNERFADFNEANVRVVSIDAGPPASAFTVRVDSSQNREGALKLRDDIKTFLESTTLKRVDNSEAQIKSVTSSNSDTYTRADNKEYVDVSADFIDDDTTTLVTLAQQAVEKEFPEERVSSYGVNKDSLDFNFGQEDENQDSFKTLALAFPIVLLVIYLLLAIQFRSLLQPILIFLAIPFSLFGITLGLYLTDNAFSFFAMLGFFALIGLSLKNTILLTDYANQGRKRGLGAVDAIHEALGERFRPLIATSLTAVVSLIPLAITSPFWEGLTVVLIFGLISSTFLVIAVFPYYYLAGEYARSLSRKGYRKIRKR